MVTEIIQVITSWVTGFIGAIVDGLEAFVAVFYDSAASTLTPLGTLALMGLGIGLVTLAIAFVTRLFKR